ncbi:MAG: hypothetical protein NVSMB65_15310 [Chloroflexota bacterium]
MSTPAPTPRAASAETGSPSACVTGTDTFTLHPARQEESSMIPDDPAGQQVVEVFGALADVLPYDSPVYRRTICTRAVIFTCQRCGQTVTQQRYPGPVPRYCSSFCQRRVQQDQTRTRVQRLRARRRHAQDGEEGPPAETP